MKIRELMTDECQAIRADHAIGDAAALMRDRDVGMLPVIDSQGNLMGTVTDRDIIVRGVADAQSRNSAVESVMSPEPATCMPDEEIETAAERMKNLQVRRMPVTDGRMHVQGVISLADIARHKQSRPLGGDVLKEVSRPA